MTLVKSVSKCDACGLESETTRGWAELIVHDWDRLYSDICSGCFPKFAALLDSNSPPVERNAVNNLSIDGVSERTTEDAMRMMNNRSDSADKL